MSTADWPAMWGKQHEALCAFFAIFARKTQNGDVELWRYVSPDRTQGYCIGVVPEEITYQVLQVVIKTMIDSYERGVSDGQAALAAAIQAPIATALKSGASQNATKTAIAELEADKGKKFANVDELMADLHADD